MFGEKYSQAQALGENKAQGQNMDLKTDEQSQLQKSVQEIQTSQLDLNVLSNKKEQKVQNHGFLLQQNTEKQLIKPKQEKFDLFDDQAQQNQLISGQQKQEQKSQGSLSEQQVQQIVQFGQLKNPFCQQESQQNYPSIFQNSSSLLQIPQKSNSQLSQNQQSQSQYSLFGAPQNPFQEPLEKNSQYNLGLLQPFQRGQDNNFNKQPSFGPQFEFANQQQQLLKEQSANQSLQESKGRGQELLQFQEYDKVKLGSQAEQKLVLMDFLKIPNKIDQNKEQGQISNENIDLLNKGQVQRNQQQQHQLGQQSGSQIFNLGKNYGIIEQNDYYTSGILEKILHNKLNYNPNYTRIYGIKHDINYLTNITPNFVQAYQDFIKFLQGKQTLIMWYEQQVKIFHQQFGIPYKLDQFWRNYTDVSSILTVQCRLELASSDPFQNLKCLTFSNFIVSDYISHQDEISKGKLQQLLEFSSKDQIVDINLIYLLSAVSGMNIMIHQNQIPSKKPVLIANGQEVSKDDFPNYNIIQLYTLDFKLFYVITPSTSDDETKLNEYIHQEVRIQEIDYTEVAKLKLEQLKKKEQQQRINKLQLKEKNNIDRLLQFFEEKIQSNNDQNDLIQEKVENNENSEILIEYEDSKKQEELN